MGLFVLAESITRYTWNFFAYKGKKATRKGHMSLLGFALLGTGYKLYVDSYFIQVQAFSKT